LREEVSPYHWVQLARFAFQACSFNHSDISPSLKSTICERPAGDYRTRWGSSKRGRDDLCIQ
jgi:hypothetical protein